MAKVKPHPQDFTLKEIFEWIGAGPKKEGVWQLRETEAAQFTTDSGIVRYQPGFRYTKWTITETGFLRWQPAYRTEWEAMEQDHSVTNVEKLA